MYVRSKNPSGMRGLGLYVRSKNPSGMSGLGCACQKRLGDDALFNSVDASEGYVPPGSGYGPSATGILATYPAGPASPSTYAATSWGDVAPSPQVSGSGIGIVPGPNSIANISTTTWILGGLGALALVVLSSGRRR
jgi:hypothetical protein